MSPVEKRVAAGAAILDERFPGWEYEVGGVIDMSDSHRCVLGQVAKRRNTFYADLAWKLSGADENGHNYHARLQWEYDNGFNPWSNLNFAGNGDIAAPAIKTAWLHEIETRRSA